MPGINSRSKGARTERELSKVIATWSVKYEFAKTPASGGLRWKAAMSKGDIICTSEGHYFPFCIECKNHKEINFSQLLVPELKVVKIFEFWAQCDRDAKLCNKVPMLCMRYNGLPKNFFFVALPTYFWNFLNKKIDTDPIEAHMKYNGEGYNLTILRSTELFKLPYKEIRLLTKEYLKNQKKK